MQQAFDVVDLVVRVCGTEREVLDKPATDGKEDSYHDGDALIVHLKDLYLDANDDHASRECQSAHSIEIVISREERVPVQPQHDKENNDCIADGHKCPPEVDFDVEPAISLALSVEFWHSEECRGSEVSLEHAYEDHG